MQGSCMVRPTHLKHSLTSSVNLPVRPASTVAGCRKITLASGNLQEMAYSTALLRIRRLRVRIVPGVLSNLVHRNKFGFSFARQPRGVCPFGVTILLGLG